MKQRTSVNENAACGRILQLTETKKKKKKKLIQPDVYISLLLMCIIRNVLKKKEKKKKKIVYPVDDIILSIYQGNHYISIAMKRLQYLTHV
jgi:hypothetical protein